MRKASTVLIFLTLCILGRTQSPNRFSYQAIVRDSENNLVNEQTVGMQISILQSSAAGTAIHTETHTPTTNSNGLVTIEIGGGATTDIFSSIDWSAGPYFIKTEIDPAGSTNYSITTTSQLLSVPYAKYADRAGNAFSGDYNDLDNAPANVSDFTNDADYLAKNGDNIEIPGNYLYENPKEHYYALSSHHFTADDPSTPLIRTNVKHVYFGAGSGFAMASAPVNLPDGAVVTSVTAYLLDNDDTEDSNLYLRWYAYNDDFGTMASVGTTNAESSSSQYIKTDTSIEDATINNNTATYFLQYFGVAGNSNIKLQSAKITYTVSGVD